MYFNLDDIKAFENQHSVRFDHRDVECVELFNLWLANHRRFVVDTSKLYILCAAIWYHDVELPKDFHEFGVTCYNTHKGIVLSGWRHGNIIRMMHALTGIKTSTINCTQGFLTSANTFVDRKEAREIALNSGQIIFDGDNVIGQNTTVSKQLFSEDIYLQNHNYREFFNNTNINW